MPVSSPSLQFKIIDETGDYIVIDKPPFLLSHPTKPTTQPTLWKELRELLAFEIAGGGQVSIVNRLDRETSGLVLVAKTAAAARKFGLLMQQQKVHKEYLATVWGWPNWERKTVDAPLDRQGKARLQQGQSYYGAARTYISRVTHNPENGRYPMNSARSAGKGLVHSRSPSIASFAE